MATADNGNFDVVFEVPDATLLTQVGALVPPGALPVLLTAPNVFTGTLSLTPTVTAVTTAAPVSLVIRFSLAGSTGSMQTVTLNGQTNPVPAFMRPISVDGTVDATDTLAMAGLALTVNFAVAANGEPLVVTALDEGTLFTNLAMTMALAQVVLDEPDESAQQAAFDTTRQLILDEMTVAVTTQLRNLLTLVGAVTLAPPPPPIPVGAVALAATTAAFSILGPQSIHLAYDYTGAAGNPALITRSMLLRNTASGAPLDALGFSIRNTFLIGSIIRPALTAGLGLAPAGFLAGHPCFWFGNAVIPFPPATPPALTTLVSTLAVRQIVVGIDGTNLRLLARFRATGIAGAFTADTSLDQAFTLTATVGAGNTLALTATPAGPPVVTNSDADIAWWVYAGAVVIGAITGGLAGMITLPLILGAIDIFGGSFANGPLGGLLAGFVPPVAIPPAPLPAGFPPLAVRGVFLTQPGSVRRPPATLAFPGLPVIAIPDPFVAEDVLINFV